MKPLITHSASQKNMEEEGNILDVEDEEVPPPPPTEPIPEPVSVPKEGDDGNFVDGKEIMDVDEEGEREEMEQEEEEEEQEEVIPQDKLGHAILCRISKTNRIYEQKGNNSMIQAKMAKESDRFLFLEILMHYIKLFDVECEKYRLPSKDPRFKDEDSIVVRKSVYEVPEFKVDVKDLQNEWKESIFDPDLLYHNNEYVKKMARLCYGMGTFLFNEYTNSYGRMMLYRLSSTITHPDGNPITPHKTKKMQFVIGGKSTPVKITTRMEDIVTMASRTFGLERE